MTGCWTVSRRINNKGTKRNGRNSQPAMNRLTGCWNRSQTNSFEFIHVNWGDLCACGPQGRSTISGQYSIVNFTEIVSTPCQCVDRLCQLVICSLPLVQNVLEHLDVSLIDVNEWVCWEKLWMLMFRYERIRKQWGTRGEMLSSETIYRDLHLFIEAGNLKFNNKE